MRARIQNVALHFVLPKSAEQQSRAILFRARERLVHQRTELVNALRASLYEYGHVVPQGIRQIKRIAEILYQSAYELTHCIHSRLAMDLIVLGRAMRSFQASQQTSTMAS